MGNIRKIVASFRPVDLDGLTFDHVVSGDVAAIFRNASGMAELAQIWADPHGRGEDAKLCRDVVRLSAEIKLDLTKLMSSRLTAAKAEKLTREVKADYKLLRKKMADLGERSVPGLGLAVPHLI